MTDSTNSPAAVSRPSGTALLGEQTVARIGYGAMQLERLAEDRAGAADLLRRAAELGVNHIDTAHYYGNGFANEMIGEARSSATAFTIVSKVGWDPDTGGPFPLKLAQRPEQLRRSVEANLRSLGLEQIPVVNLRRFDVGPGIPASPDQIVDIDDQMAEMIALRTEGLIGGIGLSSINLDVLRRALPAGIACVSNAYSLVDRSDEQMLELCVSEGIAWVPYFPLGSAFPGLPKVTDQPNVVAVAEQLNATPAQVGLAWLLHRSPNTLLIPGTASIAHLEANVAAGDLILDDVMLATLDRTAPRLTDVG